MKLFVVLFMFIAIPFITVSSYPMYHRMHPYGRYGHSSMIGYGHHPYMMNHHQHGGHHMMGHGYSKSGDRKSRLVNKIRAHRGKKT